MEVRVSLVFSDEESAAKFVHNVVRDGECYTLDEDAMGGISNDHVVHKVRFGEIRAGDRAVAAWARGNLGGIDLGR